MDAMQIGFSTRHVYPPRVPAANRLPPPVTSFRAATLRAEYDTLAALVHAGMASAVQRRRLEVLKANVAPSSQVML